jgi:hypothetical protein
MEAEAMPERKKKKAGASIAPADGTTNYGED